MRKTVSSKQLAVDTQARGLAVVNLVGSARSFFLFALCVLAVSVAAAPAVSGRSAAGQKLALVAEVPQAAQPAQKVDAAQLEAERRAAALVTEFEVNGLKVLVKKRAGSPTVAGGLFLRGGSRNITSENAGIESLMLAVATEASANFPRDRMRSQLSRMGTALGSGENYDYSASHSRLRGQISTVRGRFSRTWHCGQPSRSKTLSS